MYGMMDKPMKPMKPMKMNKNKAFKKHPMFKNGKMVMANTHAEHLKLMRMGYSHKK